MDVELRIPLPLATRNLICTAAELACYDGRAFDVDPYLLTFSAKESFYKCVNPLCGVFLDYRDVEIDFDFRRGAFTARVVHTERSMKPDLMTLQGRFHGTPTHVYTAVTLGSHGGTSTDSTGSRLIS